MKREVAHTVARLAADASCREKVLQYGIIPILISMTTAEHVDTATGRQGQHVNSCRHQEFVHSFVTCSDESSAPRYPLRLLRQVLHVMLQRSGVFSFLSPSTLIVSGILSPSNAALSFCTLFLVGTFPTEESKSLGSLVRDMTTLLAS